MPPTQGQRMDTLEIEMSELRETLQAEAEKFERLRDSMEESSKQVREDFLKVATHLTGEQGKLRDELRSLFATYTRGSEGPPPGFGRYNDLDNHGSGGITTGGNSNWKYRKLDLPSFDGQNPDGWILRAERYFSFYRLSEEEKLEAAVVAFDGEALSWYQWENRRRPIRRWEEMRALLLRQFRTTNAGSLHEQWLALEQTASVAEYRRSFIELIAPLENIPEPIALGQFLNGLKKEIRAEVRVLGPRFLEQAMELALKVEEKSKYQPTPRPSYRNPTLSQNLMDRPNNTNTQITPITHNRFYNPTPTIQKNTFIPSTSHNPKPQTRTFNRPRRLTESELQYRRENNLCFRCDGKWEAGHRCQNKELSVILVGEPTEEPEEEDGQEEPEGEETQVNAAEVSLCSVVGLTNPKTMKMLGKIKGSEVRVMIDPGATHNFISLTTIARLEIPVGQEGAFRVSLGNGAVVTGKGSCCGVQVTIQGVTITEDYLPLELGTSDLILGVQWLEKLGEIVTNWKSLLMRFRHNGEMVEIRGEPAMGRTQISLKAMIRTLQGEKEGILVEACHMIEGEEDLQGPDPPPPVRKVAYLGHVISADGVAVDQEKVRAMIDWPVPRNIRELRGFLGLTGYYRKFVEGYGKIAAPLTEQLRKDNYGWGEMAMAAFEKLKRAMTTVPVLALPDFTKEFCVEADASGFGLGAVLMQGNRPIAFYSHTLGPRSRLKSIYEKELMAIVLAVLRWRPYLLGRKFVVRTDQQSLKHLLEQREVGAEYQRWVSKLMGFDFVIQYKPGTHNRVADALSRKDPPVAELHMLVTREGVDWAKIHAGLKKDPYIEELTQECVEGLKTNVGFVVENGQLLYKGRIVLPPSTPFIQDILKAYHDGPVGGHSGELKTYLRVAQEYYWQGMRKAITNYVKACAICQQSKASSQSPAGLLQPLPIPTQVWDDISLDFIEGLPKSGNWDTILVVVDRFTKYGHFVGLKHPFTAVSVAEVFVKEIVRLHGFPSSIISDRDRIFMSKFWNELFRLQGTTLKRSTAYHPQTDGQTEIVNKALETYLRCFSSGQPRQWAKWLPWAEFWYNTSPHTSTQITPFKALYGRDPPPLIRTNHGLTSVGSLEAHLQERDAILDDLRVQLSRAQQRMKHYADTRRREVQLEKGSLAYLKLQPYRQRSLAQRPFEKLAPRFYGPYKVLQRIGEVAYKLDLPPTSKVHPVFHISQLKPAVGPAMASSEVPPQLTAELELAASPEKLLSIRAISHPQGLTKEVLLKWKDLPEYEATWENAEMIMDRFPEFHLEDKMAVWGGGYCHAPS